MRRTADRGAAVVEFALVSVPLVLLLLAVVQVVVYLHIRNVVVAGAAEGAREAAAADRSTSDGGPAAERVLAAGLPGRVDVECGAGEEAGAGGTVLVVVRCRGGVPALLAAAGPQLRIEATARALKEGR